MGSTLALSDSAATLQTQYTFEPFGNTSLAGASTTNSFAYTGRELDANNLYYYRARYYSPTLQRCEDPIEFWGGINLYVYADNSPTIEVDPQGEEGATLALGEAGCLLGPEGCLGGALIGAAIDLTILTAAAVAAYKAGQAIKNVDVGGDDPAFASPEATQAAIAELMRRLADKTLSQREREAIRRRLDELRRRFSKRKHGADKKDFFPWLPGCTSMVGSVATNKTHGTYRIPVSELRRLRALAERRQKSDQREVCGLILSDDGFRLRLVFLPNQASRPGQFLIKGQAYESARDRAKRQGESVLGTFHSHPISEGIPGAGDLKNATSGSLMLIYDVCGREARLWEIRKLRGRRRARELALSIQRQ